MKPTVGIVILSWNGSARTRTCIESVRAQDYMPRFVLVVDNASAAAERTALQERFGRFGDIEFCWLDTNRGYTGGMNVGLNAALSRGADYVLLLTQDTVLTAGAIGQLVAAASANPTVGIAGPSVLDLGARDRVLSRGERMSARTLCVPRTLLRHRRRRPAPYRVGGVLGCAMLLSRACADAAGGFEEAFFAYYEEVDLCLRARASGFTIICVPQAVVRHDGLRGFLGGFTEISAELKARNLVQLMRRWARPADWSLLAPTYIALLLGSAALYALRGRPEIVAALLRGTAAGLRHAGGATPAVLRPV